MLIRRQRGGCPKLAGRGAWWSAGALVRCRTYRPEETAYSPATNVSISGRACCRKEFHMNLKFATFTTHDGKSVIKINPDRVNYLLSSESGYTKIHFGLDQTVDVIGELEAVEAILSK